LRPDLVKIGEINIHNAEPYLGGGKLAYMKTSELSKSGILHKTDVIQVDVEKGERLATAMTESLIKSVEKFLSLEL
jgi:creatinine amidohydrolase/Fe(II)-dependent formamide hydrolase-like protein